MDVKRKIAIIGASAFQEPLIRKAQEMGLETHVFAWECGDVGETLADEFHPISITEIEEITAVCRELGISGICSIGTDLGNITVSRVANSLGLVANSVEFLDPKNASASAGATNVGFTPDAAPASNDNNAAQSDDFDVLEDDIPFPFD